MHLRTTVISFALILDFALLGSFGLSAQAPSATSQIPPDVLRVYSREVVVDVNVTDANGNPVHGLTRDDFTVTEDNHTVSPRSFREHRADDAADSLGSPLAPLPPNTFSNAGPPETVRPLYILMFDSLNTPMASQSIVRKRITEFVEKMAPGSRVAVFGLSASGQLSLVQGFTTDAESLKKAINSPKLGLQVPVLEDAGQDMNNADEAVPQAQPVERGKKAQAAQATKASDTQKAVTVDPDVECAHAAERGQYTIAAMDQIARYLSGVPGRKDLVWYTGAFPERMNGKGDVCYDLRQDLGAAEGLLSHSHVVFFPIDSRAMDIIAKDGPESRIGRRQTSEHGTMEAVAASTGGIASYNTNDLAAATTKAFDTGSNYYAITYTPPTPNNDTRQRSIHVEVDKPDLTLLYRKNYHALPLDVTLSGKTIVNATPVQTAMMRGALQPTQILFHVGVAQSPTTDAAPAPGNNPDVKLMKPPYRRFTLSYDIDASGIEFDPTPEGTYHAQFEYAVDVYDPRDGKLLNADVMSSKPNVPVAVYQSLLTGGAKFHQDVDLPASGDYILRIGVHDLTSGRIGALEIPTSTLAKP